MEQEFEEAVYVAGSPSDLNSYTFPQDNADTPWTFLYDPAGNMSSFASPSELGDTFWFYDAFGQLLGTLTPGEYTWDDFYTDRGIPVGLGGQWGYYTDTNDPLTDPAGPSGMGLILLGQPVEALLSGPLGALPLAPLSDVTSEELPGVIARMQERIREEAAPNDAAELWTGTYVLMGLRYPRELSRQLLKGVRGMKESVTYREIFEEGEATGEAKGERSLILRIGRKRFGQPDAATIAALEAVTSLERLGQLAERLLEVESWADLLADV